MSNQRKLTPLQEAFLAHLGDKDIKGDIRLAMDRAGYSEKTHEYEVTHTLADEIRELTAKWLSTRAMKAAATLVDALETENVTKATKDMLAAAREILDRGGVTKQEPLLKVGSGGFFFLPDKDPVRDIPN
jgi:hypothetical protein